MGQLHIIDHPLIQHKLTYMRKKETGSKDFRILLDEISMLMGYEVTRDLPLRDYEIETPITKMTGKVISGKKLAVIHIGLYRDPDTHKPVEYYCKLPTDIGERIVIVVDPMLATGGSASDAITMLKKRGCTNIRLMCLVAAPEGVAAVQAAHPDVDIYTAALDEKLNEHAYIVPGLGDAGDRLFGTK